MKKAVKIISISVGSLLLVYGIIMTLFFNINFGIVPAICLGLLLIAYGIFLNKLWSKKIVHIFIASLCSAVIIFGGCLFIYGNNDNADATAKTVIVLGCGISGETVSLDLAKRLDKAAQYYEKNPDVMIVVTGGQGRGEAIPEGLAMQRYLINKGISESKIIVEDKSTSTITNLANSHKIMKEKGIPDSGIVVVSNAYHLYRAVSYAKAEGFTEVRHLGTDIEWYNVPMNYMREILAVAKMWVFD